MKEQNRRLRNQSVCPNYLTMYMPIPPFPSSSMISYLSANNVPLVNSPTDVSMVLVTPISLEG